MLATLDESSVHLPGLASAHSHAFQRALRGRTHRRTSVNDNFWSWRDLMYGLTEKLDPESIYAISRFAFAEMVLAGYTSVGEFHYVQHQPGGTPYHNRTELAEAVVQAAIDVGLRITLLRVVYQRGGFNREPSARQLRFVDHDVSAAIDDIEVLSNKYATHPLVRVGVAPHSLRALGKDSISALARYASERDLPFHIHVSEQTREVEECLEHLGATPIDALGDLGGLGEQSVLVHATHATAPELDRIAETGSLVCLCRTTERDLGDGHSDAQRMARQGVVICTGIDSHAITDPFEELRAIELDERTRSMTRSTGHSATELMRCATYNGYRALGWDPETAKADAVTLSRQDPSLCGISESCLDDVVVYSASPRAVSEVHVDGVRLVSKGRISHWSEIRQDYNAALTKLFDR